MAVDDATVQHILVQVGCGVDKINSPFPLTEEMSILWDVLKGEVDAIDGIVEIPMEIPEVQIPNPAQGKKPSVAPNPHEDPAQKG